jgi:hypothetical protein
MTRTPRGRDVLSVTAASVFACIGRFFFVRRARFARLASRLAVAAEDRRFGSA